MPDVPGNSSTTSSISVGGTVNGTLEILGDHDWYRITLTAGQSIIVFVDGTTLEDPYLYIRNSAGQLLYENDDISSGNRDSQLGFTVPSSGTYYIDVGAWDEGYTGNYTVSVSVYTPPPLATNDQIANQLVEGYWGGDDHHFNVTQGGSITVNLTALTAAGQNLAREALKMWTDVIGVQFVEVSSGGQMTFDDNQEGAFANSNWSGGIITSSQVNVSTQWLASNGTGLNSYSFQTYIHEIGHALGLGHAGNYNGDATYPFDALFQNDAWATSIMSYFSQTENTYFAGQGFTENFIVTPMVADIIAMSTLYGLSTTTRTGNTTYGFNSTAGRAVFDANQNPSVTYTIFDSGGIDTLDYSGFANNQLINLNPETFSNVGTEIGNVSIARGVIIENARTSSGNDTLIGNHVANILESGAGSDSLFGGAGDDTLDGGAGVDTMNGGAGNDTYNVENSGDLVQENAGEGVDTVNSTIAYTLTANVENLVLTGSANLAGTGNSSNNSITGNAGSNFLIGGDGADHLDGGAGADQLHGGAGNDTYVVDNASDFIQENIDAGSDHVFSSINYQLSPELENLTLLGAGAINGTGSFRDNIISGNTAANVLDGKEGNDTLTGGAGNDTLTGGMGTDVFRDTASGLNGDTITDLAAGESIIFTDANPATFNFSQSGNTLNYSGGSLTFGSALTGTLTASAASGGGVQLTLSAGVPGQTFNGGSGNDTLNGGSGNDTLNGFAGNDTLNGNGGNDTLDGGAGVDAMNGGTGDDKYFVDNAGDVVTELTGQGDDWVLTSISFALAGGVSVEVMSTVNGSATDPINLTGNEFGQSLYGNAGANTLIGLGGADYMAGGGGDDRYYTDQSDIVVELVGGGDDMILVADSYILRDGTAIETLAALNQDSLTAVNLTGNEYSQSLYGSQGANTLNGGGGNDHLVGLGGNDLLIGGAGADHLAGGQGNDIYYHVDGLDWVNELAGQGDDLVIAAQAFTLREGESVETLAVAEGNAAINLTGNELAQSLYGNDGVNTLIGGGGADYMAGGGGDDRYYTDQSDIVVELAGGGDDMILVADSYILRDGTAIETLAALNQDSLNAVNLTGNEHSQSLYGTQGANTLNGGGGNDHLVGLGGNDVLIGGAGADHLAGGQGNDIYYHVDGLDWANELAGQGDDLVIAAQNFALREGDSVETLSAAEGNAAINLTGNALTQSFYGNAGNNILTGGGGADYLVGGGGNDVFVISSLALSGNSNVATVADYAGGEIVDITQVLALAGGTDPVSGGYLRVAGGQLQVDSNGGGDNYVTIANVSGSASVTIRYQSGGSATELTVARSAAQTTMTASAVAAAGMAALPAAAKEPADTTSGPSLLESAAPTLAVQTEATSALALDPASQSALTGETREALDAVAGESSKSTSHEANFAPAANPLAKADSATPAALPQGTEAPSAGEPFAQGLVADGVAMPSAEMLQALTGTAGASEQNQLVSRVILDALAGGEASGPIDALLDQIAPDHSAAGGAGHLAQVAVGLETGGGAFTAAAWAAVVVDPFGASAQAFAGHHDAPAAA